MTSPRDHLIFGCSRITHQGTRIESLRLLAEASELGIVHFDTARAYCGGESEGVLGRHMRDQRDRVIVTTKYGLAPPLSGELLTRAHSRATSIRRFSPVLRGLRGTRDLLRGSPLSPAKLQANLETSLRALGTDYVDYFLLHEATGIDAGRRPVIQTLQRLVTEGKIREFGIGSAYAKIGPYNAVIPASYRVFQFEHSPLATIGLDVALRPSRTIFTHSALSGIERVTQLLERHPAVVHRYSADIDVDLAGPGVLPGLLLAYSHSHNRAGKVIFSTRSRRRLMDNVRTFCEIQDWPHERQLALRRFFDELSARAA